MVVLEERSGTIWEPQTFVQTLLPVCLVDAAIFHRMTGNVDRKTGQEMVVPYQKSRLDENLWETPLCTMDSSRQFHGYQLCVFRAILLAKCGLTDCVLRDQETNQQMAENLAVRKL